MIYIKMLRLITHDLLIRLIPRIVFVQNVSVQCYEGARVALYSQNFDQLFSVHYINLNNFLLKKDNKGYISSIVSQSLIY